MTAPDDSTPRPCGDLLSPFLDEELFPEETETPPSSAIGMLADESPFLRDAPQDQPQTLSKPEGPEETEAWEKESAEIEEAESEGRLEEEAGEEVSEFEESIDQANTYFRIANDITSAFEGGKAGKLNLVDNGIISYGKHQATLASGSLFLILKRYTNLAKNETARSLSSYLDRVRRKDATLRGDETFKGLLRSAAHESAMQQAQDEVFAEHYWKPAKNAARDLGIRSALGHVLLYNVRVQGGLPTVIKLAKQRAGGKVSDIASGQPITEAQFLSAFVDAFIAHRLQNSASNAAKAAKLHEEIAALERQGLGSSRQAAEKRAKAKRNERNAKALKASATRTRGPSFKALVNSGDLDLRGDANGIVRLAGKPGVKIRGLRPSAMVDEVPSEYEEEWAGEEEESYLAAEDEKSYQPYTPEVEEYEEGASTEETYSPLLEVEPEEEPEELEQEWPVAGEEEQTETWSEWAEPQTAGEPAGEWGEQEDQERDRFGTALTREAATPKEKPRLARKIRTARVAADRYKKGLGYFTVRADLARSLANARYEINRLGGILTSSGSWRSLGETVTTGRSPTSLHYLGRAIDLFVGSGMQSARDPYAVVRSGGSDTHPEWEVFCEVTILPRPQSPAVTYQELDTVIWKKGGDRVVKRRGMFFSVSKVLRSHGWLAISAQAQWRQIYRCVEWWHFQNETGLAEGRTTFGDDLRKVHEAKRVEESGLALNAVWKGRSFRSVEAKAKREAPETSFECLA